MMDHIRQLLDTYHAWLKDNTQVCQVGEWVEITTPYLDRHNDCVQIYAKQGGDGIVLSDGGDTLADLEQTGCSLDSPGRRELLRTTLNGFGVRLADKALEVQASDADFALKKHSLVQAILAVGGMVWGGP